MREQERKKNKRTGKEKARKTRNLAKQKYTMTRKTVAEDKQEAIWEDNQEQRRQLERLQKMKKTNSTPDTRGEAVEESSPKEATLYNL